MYSQEQILQIMRERDVLLEGHFRLTSGRHAAYYLQCAKLLQYPDIAGPLCAQLASYFAADGVTVVAGPAMGAIVIAYEAARALNVRSVFCERESGAMALRRGLQIKPEDRVLVVEDVVTTGGSCLEVVELAQSMGATVVGVGVIVDRTGGKLDVGLPFKSLVSMEIASFLPEDCPLCAQGLPVVKPGSRPDTV